MPVLDDVETDPPSPPWLRAAVWISIPLSAVAFGMAAFSILDITSGREGRTVTGAAVAAAGAGSGGAPALHRVVATGPVAPATVATSEDARLAWLRAEGAAEQARITALVDSARELAEAEADAVVDAAPVADAGGGGVAGLGFAALPAAPVAVPPGLPDPEAPAALPGIAEPGLAVGGTEDGLARSSLAEEPVVPQLPAAVASVEALPRGPAVASPPSGPGAVGLPALPLPLPRFALAATVPAPPALPAAPAPEEVHAPLVVAAPPAVAPRREVTRRQVRQVEPSRVASLAEGAARVAAGAPHRRPIDPRCGPLLVRLQLGERPTDADRTLLRTACAPRR